MRLWFSSEMETLISIPVHYFAIVVLPQISSSAPIYIDFKMILYIDHHTRLSVTQKYVNNIYFELDTE